MAFKTYITVKGEINTYPFKIYLYSNRKKRPRCSKCYLPLRYMRVRIDFKETTVGYYCPDCKIGFLNRARGKFFICDIESQEKGVKE